MKVGIYWGTLGEEIEVAKTFGLRNSQALMLKGRYANVGAYAFSALELSVANDVFEYLRSAGLQSILAVMRSLLAPARWRRSSCWPYP